MKRPLLLLSVCGLLGATAPAAAHGDVVSTSLEDGASVDQAPKRVTVTLSETPTDDASFVVKDGCDRRVVSEVSVDGDTIIARIEDAQPGRWSASWKAISAVDGHPTEGELSFSVRGPKDCTPDEPTPKPTEEPSPEPSEGADTNTDVDIDAEPASDSGSSFPIVPVVIGVAIIGVAIAARSFAGR